VFRQRAPYTRLLHAWCGTFTKRWTMAYLLIQRHIHSFYVTCNACGQNKWRLFLFTHTRGQFRVYSPWTGVFQSSLNALSYGPNNPSLPNCRSISKERGAAMKISSTCLKWQNRMEQLLTVADSIRDIAQVYATSDLQSGTEREVLPKFFRASFGRTLVFYCHRNCNGGWKQ
jgi:hypothetical protein